MHRRHFLASAAALAAAGTVAPRRAFAETSVALGEARLRALSDGHLSLPAGFVYAAMPQDRLGAALAPFGKTPEQALTPPCNVTLLQDGERTVLFDVGAGPSFQSTAGRLGEALEAAGIGAGDVTHVVFTHGHPDHLWGVLDDFDDPMFPNATHMIGKAEWDYWTDPATVDSIGAERAVLAAGASRRLALIEDAMEFFEDGQEILPGLAAHLTPGHTPGHMSFELRRGSESAMIIGDAIGNDHIAFARPDWFNGPDQDQPLAAKTRAALLDRLAAEKMPISGFHFEGAFGRVEKTAEGYRLVPLSA